MTLFLLPESMGRAAAEQAYDHVVPGLVHLRLLEDGKEFDMPREMLTEIPNEPGPDVFAVALVDAREHYHSSSWWRRDNDASPTHRWVDPDGFGRDWPWVVRWSLEHHDGQVPVPLVLGSEAGAEIKRLQDAIERLDEASCGCLGGMAQGLI